MDQKSITVNYKGESHKLTPVVTDRFVWHLSGSYHRESIQAKGFEPKNGLTFANNQCTEIGEMWHWELESRYCGLTESRDDIIFNKICSRIDFWRIDTIKSRSTWYLDPNLNPYYLYTGENVGHRYVCTENNIPLECIELYRFDLNTYRRIKYGKNKKWTNRPEGQLPLLKIS